MSLSERKPRDCSPRIVSNRARSIVPYRLNSSTWEWHEQTGTDHGTDMILELVEDGLYSNRKVEVQIKGTQNLELINDNLIVYDFDVKTVNYALGTANAFVLFLVDIVEEVVYYLAIQEYFMRNPQKMNAAKSNNSSVRIQIPVTNTINENTVELCELARRTYYRDNDGKINAL